MDSREQVIKKFHPHPLGYIVFYFSGIVFVVVSFFLSWYLLAVGLLVFILGEVSRRAETFYVLDSGVAREYRLLSTSREFAEYNKIQDIKINQSFLENIFHIGNINFDTAGGDTVEVSFHGVRDPYEIETLVREKMK